MSNFPADSEISAQVTKIQRLARQLNEPRNHHALFMLISDIVLAGDKALLRMNDLRWGPPEEQMGG